MTLKTYKYWLFYLGGKIYGYTDNKEVADTFKAQRDMRQFTMKKEDLNSEEVHWIAENHKSKIINIRKLKTSDDRLKHAVDILFALTDIEYNSVRSLANFHIYNKLYVNCWDNPNIFNGAIYDALRKIGYLEFYRTIIGMDTKNPKSEDNVILTVDEFQVFLNEYGSMINKS